MTDGGGKKCKKRGKVKAENFSGMDMNLAKTEHKEHKTAIPSASQISRKEGRLIAVSDMERKKSLLENRQKPAPTKSGPEPSVNITKSDGDVPWTLSKKKFTGIFFLKEGCILSMESTRGMIGNSIWNSDRTSWKIFDVLVKGWLKSKDPWEEKVIRQRARCDFSNCIGAGILAKHLTVDALLVL